ncbi:uncharacterized protein LOC119334006 [Triticum dicoccoides]|uniref:uncharacterized protein LOC119334006 n=1 Tax=Triticum dicoccoides TaxID=85692 RepID=UPI001890FFAE|nr:uncharacterized protein LOC119334006 [Triticum dicoccoides]
MPVFIPVARELTASPARAARPHPPKSHVPLHAAPYERVELPCFQRATSISLSASSSVIYSSSTLRPSETSPRLQVTTIILCGSTPDALADLVRCCPRLRTLRFLGPSAFYIGIPLNITVALQEHVLEWESQARVSGIDVAAPMLEQLTLSARVGDDHGVSVLAPMADNVSWHCRYGSKFMGMGYWTLERVSLVMSPPARRHPPVLHIQSFKHRYLISGLLWTQDNLAGEVEKHLQMQFAADLSVAVHFSVFDLELHLAPMGHVYGAVSFYFLRMHTICTTIRRLKVAVPQSMVVRDKEKCQEYCGCEPPDWTSQIVSLTKLKDVEIDGFQGDKREFDFLEHLLRCAPMLINVILRHSSEGAPSEAKIHEFSLAHPSVEWHYVISSVSVSMAP